MKVVVVGGNAAGMSAASQVKRQQPGWQVVVLERGSYISYASCGIPYYLGGLVESPDRLLALTPETAVQERGIDLRLNQEVTAVKPESREVLVRRDGEETREAYDTLVLCTGALAMTAGIDIGPGERIFTIKDLSDGVKVMELLQKYRPQKCAVVGGGYIAVEMLEAFHMRGIETHLVHRRPELARTFEPEVSGAVLKEMERRGIVLNLRHGVEKILEKDGRAEVHTSGGILAYDLVLVATGVVPNSDLAAACGIELGAKGSIRVNPYLETSLPRIYAAGDCTETTHLITGRPVYVPLALKANKEGAIAGANICGERRRFPGIIGSALTKFYDLGVGRTGLTLEEARQAGFDAVKYSIAAGSKAEYYPGRKRLEVLVVAEKGSGRVLGAQMLGPEDAVKRIDLLAAAIQRQMTLQEVYDLDLAYAPPFGGVYDPVLLAARVGLKKV
jgi:CoA-dependent NAD(P)H sulfur oxidoreductase